MLNLCGDLRKREILANSGLRGNSGRENGGEKAQFREKLAFLCSYSRCLTLFAGALVQSGTVRMSVAVRGAALKKAVCW